VGLFLLCPQEKLSQMNMLNMPDCRYHCLELFYHLVPLEKYHKTVNFLHDFPHSLLHLVAILLNHSVIGLA
jgi:hypothetical protein